MLPWNGASWRSREPRAETVRYDRRNSRMTVNLTNGCTFAFPPCLAQGLKAASDDELNTVEILGSRSIDFRLLA
jgi:hypothetical protein|tara:strand:+ start:1284 stop:1505 length:222 start_codon:yes stop_codon:yes gene_type:complete